MLWYFALGLLAVSGKFFYHKFVPRSGIDALKYPRFITLVFMQVYIGRWITNGVVIASMIFDGTLYLFIFESFLDTG